MSFVIKEVSFGEVSLVTSLVHESLPEDFPYKQETIEAYIKSYDEIYFTKVMGNQRNCVFGAYDNDKLLGVIILKPDNGGVVYVDWLVVKKEAREEGVGSLLLKKADQWALTNKYHYFYLYTETDKNIDFYTKRGFVYIGKHENSWFGETEHILGKQLRNKPFPEVF